MINNTALKSLQTPLHWLAFGFGSGLARRAPGTFGTLAAVPLYFLLAPLSLPLYGAVVVVAFISGIYICGKTATDLGVKDHPGIVWDEFVGYWLTMFAAPSLTSELGWIWPIVGFLLFRLFDIWKPWPIRVIDRNIHSGFGIMLDDVLAGLFALICLQIAAWVIV